MPEKPATHRSAAPDRRFDPRTFVVASLAAAAILVSIVAIPQWLSKQARWEALRANVGEIAQLAASVVDGDLHRKLLDPTNYSEESYAHALKPLVRFHSANPDIYYLYTMMEDVLRPRHRRLCRASHQARAVRVGLYGIVRGQRGI